MNLVAVLAISAVLGCGGDGNDQSANATTASGDPRGGSDNSAQRSRTPAQNRPEQSGYANVPALKNDGRLDNTAGATSENASPSVADALQQSGNLTTGNAAAGEQADGQQSSRPGALFWNDQGAFAQNTANSGFYPRRTFDDELLEQYGIRHIAGARLDLYTDIAPSPALENLPHVFELAHAEWCKFFGIDPDADSAWRMNGFVMADRSKFQQSGLLPADLPPFANAYCRDFEFWMDEKSTDYYRRHLALHEGTHGFMLTHISGNYPEWYFEGIAEFLGTHKLEGDLLTLGFFPEEVGQVPMWGRVGLLRQGYRSGRMHPWKQIMTQGLPRTDDLVEIDETEFYAWVWGWCAFMDGMPAYRDRFLKLHELRNQPDFASALAHQYSTEWAELNDNWQVFVSEVEYDYDFERNAIQFAPGKELPSAGKDVEIDSGRGWQSTGIRLEAGQNYEITATGRYVMFRDETQPAVVWESEPQGISIQYFNGLPIGMLQAVIVPDDRDPAAASPFLSPSPIGIGVTETAAQTGTLYLRINDNPAQRADNTGFARATVRPVG